MGKEESIDATMKKYGFEPDTKDVIEIYAKFEEPGEEPYLITVTSELKDELPSSLDEPVCVDVFGGDAPDIELEYTKTYASLREYLKTLDE